MPLIGPMLRCHESASAVAGRVTFGASTPMFDEQSSRVPVTCQTGRLKPLVSMRELSSAKAVMVPFDIASGTDNSFFLSPLTTTSDSPMFCLCPCVSMAVSVVTPVASPFDSWWPQ